MAEDDKQKDLMKFIENQDLIEYYKTCLTKTQRDKVKRVYKKAIQLDGKDKELYNKQRNQAKKIILDFKNAKHPQSPQQPIQQPANKSTQGGIKGNTIQKDDISKTEEAKDDDISRTENVEERIRKLAAEEREQKTKRKQEDQSFQQLITNKESIKDDNEFLSKILKEMAEKMSSDYNSLNDKIFKLQVDSLKRDYIIKEQNTQIKDLKVQIVYLQEKNADQDKKIHHLDAKIVCLQEKNADQDKQIHNLLMLNHSETINRQFYQQEAEIYLAKIHRAQIITVLYSQLAKRLECSVDELKSINDQNKLNLMHNIISKQFNLTNYQWDMIREEKIIRNEEFHPPDAEIIINSKMTLKKIIPGDEDTKIQAYEKALEWIKNGKIEIQFD
ncbi:hypothetical protein TTHERM_00672000 (macronuclear) [Tetrahymena thermophila SB210]|uniref:Uncharacterized protein n=1 Tax=Tetrahymena thermophila (strain SB210) TaxID=312017 RepID=Q23E55_TETTS|nr:hypothetical protein TTHERM_00672000 [Tetrahymena thermophila SB210]EAR94732.1 hypothetical protein TTHERM_00672000 [Tetrahymena thermophila SB210]|eukprot:XP_001014977.1 hypothetical protein TTHERM_00672000 [Tetrahymena thermophila SB210]